MNRHSGTLSRPGSVSCSTDNPPHNLMAQQHRSLQNRLTGSAVLPVVQVGPAHSAVRDLHNSLIGGRGIHLNGFNPQVTGSVRYYSKNLHGPAFHTTVVMPPSMKTT